MAPPPRAVGPGKGIPAGLLVPPTQDPHAPPGPAKLDAEGERLAHQYLPPEQVNRLEYDMKLQRWVATPSKIEMAQGYFARGATRVAYRMNEYTSEGKRSKVLKFLDPFYLEPLVGSVTQEMYENDCMCQYTAAYFADRYNSTDPPKNLTVLPIYLIEFVNRPGRPIGMVEPWLPEGQFQKHNNNNGGVLTESQTPQAFSHFTYEMSGHSLIVVDVQGVGEVYTDPQVHSLDQQLYGLGNQGKDGIRKFLETHSCNGVCLSLGLTRIHEGRISTPWPEETRRQVMQGLGKDRTELAPDVLDKLRAQQPSYGRAGRQHYDFVVDGNGNLAQQQQQQQQHQQQQQQQQHHQMEQVEYEEVEVYVDENGNEIDPREIEMHGDQYRLLDELPPNGGQPVMQHIPQHQLHQVQQHQVQQHQVQQQQFVRNQGMGVNYSQHIQQQVPPNAVYGAPQQPAFRRLQPVAGTPAVLGNQYVGQQPQGFRQPMAQQAAQPQQRQFRMQMPGVQQFRPQGNVQPGPQQFQFQQPRQPMGAQPMQNRAVVGAFYR